MAKKPLGNWAIKLPLHLSLGAMLCVNYSCNSSRSLTDHDPFRKNQAGAVASNEIRQGVDFDFNYPDGYPPGHPQHPNSQPQAAGTQHASLQDSLAEVNSQVHPDAATIKVKEWPAIPEKTMGVKAPLLESHVLLDQSVQLPVGGYERPLSEGDPWPVAELKPPAAAQAAAQTVASAPEMPTHLPLETSAQVAAQATAESTPETTPTAAASPEAQAIELASAQVLSSTEATPSAPEMPVIQQAVSEQRVPEQTVAEQTHSVAPDFPLNDPFLSAQTTRPELSEARATTESTAAAQPLPEQRSEQSPEQTSGTIQTASYQAADLPAVTSQQDAFASRTTPTATYPEWAQEKPEVTLVSHQQPQQPLMQQTTQAVQQVAQKPDVERTPHDARHHLPNASGSWGTGSRGSESYSPDLYPDEYIKDGGDRGMPIHYGQGYRNGLETQDTIVEYQDESGKMHVKATNEVAVYSPRFGAVRMVSGSSENLSIDRALGAYDQVNGLQMDTRLKPNIEQQNEQLNAALVRSSPSGLETESITLGMNQATKLADHTKLENTNTNYGSAGIERLERTQTPVTNAGIQAAAQWTRKQSPVIVASDVQGAEAYAWFRPQEEVGIEENKRPGKLYIDKAVDLLSAKPGDILTFTIRYKNTGEKSLFNVNVIDNLTPRLEYIEGSATSDRNGKLVVEDNQEGSLILKWEISEEITGGTNGMITFKAKVR